MPGRGHNRSSPPREPQTPADALGGDHAPLPPRELHESFHGREQSQLNSSGQNLGPESGVISDAVLLILSGASTANLKFTFGAYDNVENPGPTGMACEGITNTATFSFLWEFCEKNCPELNKLALWKSSCNFFAPGENALYHDDDDTLEAMTLIYYANKFWDINDGGETKLFTDAKKMIYAIVLGLKIWGRAELPVQALN